jgi:hypothetical protein
MNKILGTYKITYQRGVIQYKNLISHDIYVDIIKPIISDIYDLEILLGKKNVNKKSVIEQIQECKKKISDIVLVDEWFTNKSPLYNVIDTGILSLPKHQGGDTKCKVELIS